MEISEGINFTYQMNGNGDVSFVEFDNFIPFIKYVTSESTMSESACSNLDVRIALNGLAVKSRWHLLSAMTFRKR